VALFIISWTDKPGGLPVRMATREAHLAYVASKPGVVRLGGPYLSEGGDMAGSMLIVEAESLEAAQAFHDADPYKAAGLFETSQVRPWRITVGALA
jgi:uncharacterized protein YciI